MLSPLRRTRVCLIAWMASILLPCAAVASDLKAPQPPTKESWPAQTRFISQPEATAPAEELPNFDNQLTPPGRLLQQPPHEPPEPCDCVPAEPTQPPSLVPENMGFLRRCIWNWAPEGVIPYWGRRTPDSRKDLGIGQPLSGGGWRAQPFAISGFAGATNGGPIIRGHVYEHPSPYAGANFSWDYDHFFGFEKRLGFGALNLTNAQGQQLSPTGLSITGEYRLMYYPLGDSRWRPFFTAGVGWSTFEFYDDFHHHHLDALLFFPYGVGLKYLWSEHWALRIDLIDELTLSSNQTSTFHYVALTAGLEFRYGKRLLNLPWHRKDSK